jgi:hypothetical protein
MKADDAEAAQGARGRGPAPKEGRGRQGPRHRNVLDCDGCFFCVDRPLSLGTWLVVTRGLAGLVLAKQTSSQSRLGRHACAVEPKFHAAAGRCLVLAHARWHRHWRSHLHSGADGGGRRENYMSLPVTGRLQVSGPLSPPWELPRRGSFEGLLEGQALAWPHRCRLCRRVGGLELDTRRGSKVEKGASPRQHRVFVIDIFRDQERQRVVVTQD